MRIRTMQAVGGDPEESVAELHRAFRSEDQRRPDFLALHFAVGTDAVGLHNAAIDKFGDGALHGGSSCLGIMTETGANIETGAAVGGLAIWDADGSYGTGSAELGNNAFKAAQQATEAAIVAAQRIGEVPDLVWLTVAPGREEQVVDGIRSVIGPSALIVGGSSADNDVSGQWAQFGPSQIHGDGVVVSALFPSTPGSSFYQSGYAPTGDSGRVTRVSGRRLFEIDGQPAAEVYHRWTGGSVSMAKTEPLSILAETALCPLGRITREIAGVPFHLLAHPAVAYPDGSLDLFADLNHGDQIWQMQGSADSLVTRAGRIARQAREDAGGAISGALIVYCGGCMLAMRGRMDEVRSSIVDALGEVPWLGVFTFGEQGVPPGGAASHGNLMISCTAFGK